MKKLLVTLLLSPLLLTFTRLHSQEVWWDKTAKFEDGTTVRYNLESIELTDVTSLHVSALLAVQDIARFVHVDYFVPGKMALRVFGGRHCFGGEGFFYFANKTKTVKQKILIGQGFNDFNDVDYVTYEPIPRMISFGIHGGYAYKNYGSPNSFFTKFPFTTNELTLGLAMTTGRHMYLEVENWGKKMATSVLNISADVHLYAGSATTGLAADSTSLDPKTISNPIGFSVTLDGRQSLSRKVDFGLTYLVGGGVCALGYYPKFGIGMYFGFF